jgi:DNA repair exonuclease SbcCD ATPase subunit
MSAPSNTHFYVNWAKERLNEMEATLTSLEGKVDGVQAEVRSMADKVLADLRTKRDEFRDAIKRNAEANEAAWVTAMARLETDWKTFESDVAKYVESFSRQIEQHQAIFEHQAAAQLKAWREAADKLAGDASGFAAESRAEIDATLKRMQADAAAAEEKLQKLNKAGVQSWSALMAALTETRTVFDRANQAAREAFKRAA